MREHSSTPSGRRSIGDLHNMINSRNLVCGANTNTAPGPGKQSELTIGVISVLCLNNSLRQHWEVMNFGDGHDQQDYIRALDLGFVM